MRRLTILILAAVALCARGAAGADKPNILVILSDDGGMAMSGFNAQLHRASTEFQTPNLDALAAQSAIARQGYASASICGPARVGLLTGMYPQRLGLEHNIGQNINEPGGFAANQPLISSRLKQLGYTTGMVGKWHGGYVDGVTRPGDLGFDEFFGFLSGSRSYYADAQPANAMMRNNTNIEGAWRSQGDQSQYDPVRGRYATDAYAEEAVDFINRHAQEDEPFFMYASFTAPHTPDQVKSSDYNQFSHIADNRVRILAAQTYAMDRGIGKMLDALDAQGVRDNTLIFFLNDNGGVSQVDNAPFRGGKGSFYEGGVRTPFLVNGPGIVPGAFEAPVTMFDILPTAVAAAGGSADSADMAGIDLNPYLSGQAPAPSRAPLFYRFEKLWSVRDGDWKLTRPLNGAPVQLYDLATDPSEQTDLMSSEPAVVTDLLRKLTSWEATLRKPNYGFDGVEGRNAFDHFVFRNDQNLAAWQLGGLWYRAGTTTPATMRQDDGYANAIFEFTTRNDGNYTAHNAFTRLTGYTYMANELRWTGEFSSATPRTAMLNGNALLFVKNLNGGGPKIRLDATATPGSAAFTFFLNQPVELFDDLEITGDGTQTFLIGNVIKDYYEPRNVLKTGTSTVIFNAMNTYKGATIVRAGEIRFINQLGGLDDSGGLIVETGARVRLERGRISTEYVEILPGAQFQFVGGRLETAAVYGHLANQGGVLAGSDTPGPIPMSKNYSQTAASEFEARIGEIGGDAYYDSLAVTGSVQLAGALDVDIVDLGGGLYEPELLDQFDLITALDGVTGTFSSTSLPTLANSSYRWSLLYQPSKVTLRVVLNQTLLFTPNDGIDSLDLAAVKLNFGMTGASLAHGDANGDAVVDGADFLYWQRHCDQPGGVAAIPEATSSELVITAAGCLAVGAGLRGKRREMRLAPVGSTGCARFQQNVRWRTCRRPDDDVPSCAP